VHRDCNNDHSICYQVLKELCINAPPHKKDILATHKYLGVPTNAQLDNSISKEKIIVKLHQRIGLISAKVDSIQETKIAHNMLVCQVATFSLICINMSLQECADIDKQLLKAYHHRLKFMNSDTKHNIFISDKRGGIGVRCFTREYISALLQDIEVYISKENSLPVHALKSSIEEATKLALWNLHLQSRKPNSITALSRIRQLAISGRKTLTFQDTFKTPYSELVTYDHSHIMAQAISTTSALGFMLHDLKYEFVSRFIDELLLQDKKAKAIGNVHVKGKGALNAIIGKGNLHFTKYSLLSHIYLFLLITME
jgi:hypothetical protein